MQIMYLIVCQTLLSHPSQHSPIRLPPPFLSVRLSFTCNHGVQLMLPARMLATIVSWPCAGLLQVAITGVSSWLPWPCRPSIVTALSTLFSSSPIFSLFSPGTFPKPQRGCLSDSESGSHSVKVGLEFIEIFLPQSLEY